ncbi:unnamed protein product, partial [Ectocarpus sp. 12 AP-2014]
EKIPVQQIEIGSQKKTSTQLDFPFAVAAWPWSVPLQWRQGSNVALTYTIAQMLTVCVWSHSFLGYYVWINKRGHAGGRLPKVVLLTRGLRCLPRLMFIARFFQPFNFLVD